MNNENRSSLENKDKVIEKKNRKTLDQYLGINGLGIIAVVGTFIGGVLRPIGTGAAISAIYYLIKKRKTLISSQKWTGWILVVAWISLLSIISGSFTNNQ